MITRRSAEDEVTRKHFFVSAIATTTTLQTRSVCFYTPTPQTKRTIDMDGGLSLKDAAPIELKHSLCHFSSPKPPYIK